MTLHTPNELDGGIACSRGLAAASSTWRSVGASIPTATTTTSRRDPGLADARAAAPEVALTAWRRCSRRIHPATTYAASRAPAVIGKALRLALHQDVTVSDGVRARSRPRSSARHQRNRHRRHGRRQRRSPEDPSQADCTYDLDIGNLTIPRRPTTLGAEAKAEKNYTGSSQTRRSQRCAELDGQVILRARSRWMRLPTTASFGRVSAGRRAAQNAGPATTPARCPTLSRKPRARWMQHAILLLGHGTVENLDDLPPFLANIRRGRPAPPELVHEIRRRYEAHRRARLLLRISRELAANLEKTVGQRVTWRCASGIRSPKTCCVKFRTKGARVAQGGAPGAVQRARLRRRNAATCRRAARAGSPPPSFAARPTGAPSRFSSSLCATLSAPRSLASPTRTTISGARALHRAQLADRHRREGRPVSRRGRGHGRSGRASSPAHEPVARGLPEPGRNAGGRGSAPTCARASPTSPSQGAKDVILCPIGFLGDHVEILYDLDVEAKAWARIAGAHPHAHRFAQCVTDAGRSARQRSPDDFNPLRVLPRDLKLGLAARGPSRSPTACFGDLPS